MINSELQTELADICHRTGTTATRIPKFIQRAESMIANRLRSLENINTGGLLVEVNRIAGGLYSLPADFLGLPKRGGLKASSNPAPLELTSYGALMQYSLSAPVAFANVVGRRIEFRGAPSTNETVSVIYFYRLAALAAPADTNGVLTLVPELYLHAALHWLHIDAQDLDMSNFHKGLFEDEIDRVNLVADRAMRSGAVAFNQAAPDTRSAM